MLPDSHTRRAVVRAPYLGGGERTVTEFSHSSPTIEDIAHMMVPEMVAEEPITPYEQTRFWASDTRSAYCPLPELGLRIVVAEHYTRYPKILRFAGFRPEKRWMIAVEDRIIPDESRDFFLRQGRRGVSVRVHRGDPQDESRSKGSMTEDERFMLQNVACWLMRKIWDSPGDEDYCD